MVIRGGENVYPREIEEFLYRHPKIQDVQVFGVPDERYGEELCAWIKLRAGETLTAEEVREFCRDQIAHYKVPRHIRFVDEFPMTVTGKMQKFIMRERMAAELGVKEAVTAYGTPRPSLRESVGAKRRVRCARRRSTYATI